jgi:GNAT superfamily N-acetyltransferase
MALRREGCRLATVSSRHAAAAYDFHKKVASSNAHIWPRTERQIEEMAQEGSLFGLWCAGAIVALVYAHLDEDSAAWEVGGLTVEKTLQKRGFGTLLVRFALAHTLAFQSPWLNGQQIVAHVHEANDEPRRLLATLGFERSGSVTIPGTEAPASMRRDAEGNVVGDEFRFTRLGAAQLARWFREEFDVLAKAESLVIDLGKISLENLRTALEAIETEPGSAP